MRDVESVQEQLLERGYAPNIAAQMARDVAQALGLPSDWTRLREHQFRDVRPGTEEEKRLEKQVEAAEDQEKAAADLAIAFQKANDELLVKLIPSFIKFEELLTGFVEANPFNALIVELGLVVSGIAAFRIALAAVGLGGGGGAAAAGAAGAAAAGGATGLVSGAAGILPWLGRLSGAGLIAEQAYEATKELQKLPVIPWGQKAPEGLPTLQDYMGANAEEAAKMKEEAQRKIDEAAKAPRISAPLSGTPMPAGAKPGVHMLDEAPAQQPAAPQQSPAFKTPAQTQREQWKGKALRLAGGDWDTSHYGAWADAMGGAMSTNIEDRRGEADERNKLLFENTEELKRLNDWLQGVTGGPGRSAMPRYGLAGAAGAVRAPQPLRALLGLLAWPAGALALCRA
jgi:hypothetical protein